jgi:hypothetical protein
MARVERTRLVFPHFPMTTLNASYVAVVTNLIFSDQCNDHARRRSGLQSTRAPHPLSAFLFPTSATNTAKRLLAASGIGPGTTSRAEEIEGRTPGPIRSGKTEINRCVSRVRVSAVLTAECRASGPPQPRTVHRPRRRFESHCDRLKGRPRKHQAQRRPGTPSPSSPIRPQIPRAPPDKSQS